VADAKPLKVLRPYASVEEYLAAEGESIDAKGMILFGHELAEGTTLRFEIVLKSKQKPIRAEAKVVARTGADAGRPQGARVRFKRLDAATKELIERMLAERATAPDAAPEEQPSEPTQAEPPPPEPPHPEPSSRSGTRHRAVGAVAAPPNRDELLERLRARARR
jgi:hypothetical protein